MTMRLAFATLALTSALVACQQQRLAPDPSAAEPASWTPPDKAHVEPEVFDWAPLLERIVLVGSSSTAGFGVMSAGGAGARLADFIDAAIDPEHRVALDEGDAMLFLNPEPLGALQIQRAHAADPTLLVAIDFPFWFFYGQGASTAERLERLEGGLELLDGFTCDIVVGDLPYMIKAAGGMIPWSMMPDEEGFAPANARIAEWAAARDNVTLVSLDAVHQKLETGGVYSMGSFTWDAERQGPLLQPDELHPNMAGTAAMAVEILAALAQTKGATLESVARGTLEELVAEVDAAVNAY